MDHEKNEGRGCKLLVTGVKRLTRDATARLQDAGALGGFRWAIILYDVGLQDFV